ncbi:unnamed protein product [Closterium sp. Yama58-4]|nr:unnamed protein product [Closterium sp. Yama58-4]
MSWKTVGTSVVLYNAPSFANSPATLAPAVLRAPAPNSSACTVVPKGFNGTVGSLRIMWNVNDGASDHLVCGKVVFWDKNDCSGSSFVYEIPGKWTAAKADNFKYATTSVKKAAGVVAAGRSFSCLAAVKPPVTDLCATAACPPNSKCVLTNSSFAQCVCDPGLTLPESSPLHHSPASNNPISLPFPPGVVPDVADIAISIYSTTSFGTQSGPPYVFRLKPNKCVTIPAAVVASSKSVGILFRAPATYVRCTTMTIYTQPFCTGISLSSAVPINNDLVATPIP